MPMGLSLEHRDSWNKAMTYTPLLSSSSLWLSESESLSHPAPFSASLVSTSETLRPIELCTGRKLSTGKQDFHHYFHHHCCHHHHHHHHYPIQVYHLFYAPHCPQAAWKPPTAPHWSSAVFSPVRVHICQARYICNKWPKEKERWEMFTPLSTGQSGCKWELWDLPRICSRVAMIILIISMVDADDDVHQIWN